jgi:hypothetical protein
MAAGTPKINKATVAAMIALNTWRDTGDPHHRGRQRYHAQAPPVHAAIAAR